MEPRFLPNDGSVIFCGRIISGFQDEAVVGAGHDARVECVRCIGPYEAMAVQLAGSLPFRYVEFEYNYKKGDNTLQKSKISRFVSGGLHTIYQATMKIPWLIVFFIALLSLLLFSDAGRSDALVGGWSPIKDVNDPHVVEIANYAVTEYDKRSGAKLKLLNVVKGQTQVVAGTNYRLILETTNDSATKNYRAIVWEKPWLHFRNLTSFDPLLT
ncbi:hypothetical protein VNO78_02403 [Psophocarpus tetragonolobus]|uniref:Cystatin domain-containing protein n=1 Tax=Psophocarpus tetragonolobus TaxID=3891 RepID=A0AAN9TBM1_PSOTE